MATDPESAALIEKLLETEDPYLYDAVDGDLEDDPHDADYVETHSRKKPRNARPRGKGENETNRRRRKDSGQQRRRGRSWTEAEEALFLEALETYGRNWKQCAQYVGSRDARSVQSHAQKHFIKLCLQGESLPEKVAETGCGYTLSGKLLDPLSSSAQSYGFRSETIKSSSPEGAPTKRGVLDLSEEKMEIVRAGIMMENLDKEIELKPKQPQPQTQPQSPPKAPLAEVERVPPKGPRAEAAPKDDSWEYMRRLRTDYALNRPQRAAARNRRVQMGSTSESIQLVECEEFMSNSESSGGISQPFTIDISAEAMLMMDFHAHLSEFEIIGLMAGTWDAERRHLTVCEAFPCRRLSGTGDRTSVELDPASEVQARSEMVQKGFVSTGWYHSHPVFSATPSMKDIENQRNYQALFRDAESEVEPFVGWIISPYDMALPSPKSRMCGFCVLQKDQGIKPFRLRSNLVNRLERFPEDLVDKCGALLGLVNEEEGRMDLSKEWREWTFLQEEKKAGAALTKIAKLKLSLMSYFAEESMEHGRALGEAIEKRIEQVWDIQLNPANTVG